MKLEIKHLAPYLPYALKCEIITTTDNVLIENLTGFDCRFSEYALFGNVKNGTNGVGLFGDCKLLLTSVKPILRPLSDIMIHMAYIMPLINAHSKNLEIEVEQISDMFPAIMSNYDIASKLFEFHYDVFGLIEKGLAINLNDIK